MTVSQWLDLMDGAIHFQRNVTGISNEPAMRCELEALVWNREGDSARWFLPQRAAAVMRKYQVRK